MALFDDDLRPTLVSEPTTYFYGTQSEVLAAPITIDGTVEGYVFAGVDAAENAGGLVFRMPGVFTAVALKHWRDELKRLFAEGVPALAAVTSLLGTTGPDGAGRVGDELFRAVSKSVLKAELNPREAVPARGGRVDPALIDAVLRGEASPSPEVTAAIEGLDSALRIKPTPDDLVVALVRDPAALPTDLAPGVIVEEPTYLNTVIRTDATSFPGAAGVLYLRVPAGTPALYVPAPLPDHPGTLLLARGLRWRAVQVETDSPQPFVSGVVLDS